MFHPHPLILYRWQATPELVSCFIFRVFYAISFASRQHPSFRRVISCFFPSIEDKTLPSLHCLINKHEKCRKNNRPTSVDGYDSNLTTSHFSTTTRTSISTSSLYYKPITHPPGIGHILPSHPLVMRCLVSVIPDRNFCRVIEYFIGGTSMVFFFWVKVHLNPPSPCWFPNYDWTFTTTFTPLSVLPVRIRRVSRFSTLFFFRIVPSPFFGFLKQILR